MMGTLPNPIQGWTCSQVVAAVAFLFVGTTLALRCIECNDVGLASTIAPRSGALQRCFTPSAARDVVVEWKDKGVVGVASRGTVIDTVLLVPMYSCLLAVLCFAAARGFPQASRWGRVALTLGWAGWGAGLFDLIENAGIFAELHLHTYGVAPVVGAASSVKWILIGLDGAFLVGWIVFQAWQLVAG